MNHSKGQVDINDLLAVITSWNCPGGGGGVPLTISACFNEYCAGLEGTEWQDCMNRCIEAVCQSNPSECE